MKDLNGTTLIERSDIKSLDYHPSLNLITGYNEEKEIKVIFDPSGYILFGKGRYDQFKVHNQLVKLTKNGINRY